MDNVRDIMWSPERVLNSLNEHSKDSSYKFERLYRILFNEELFYVAYQKIASNGGSTTKGSDGRSIDEMSLARIETLIASLKDESYQQLMKAGSGNDGAAIYFVGNDDEHIEEFVVLAGKKENGFAVVRVLGNDMNPTHIMNMLTLLQKSQVDMEQLKPLQQLMK